MRRMLRTAALSVFALSTLLVASCDSVDRVSAPSDDYAPQAVRVSPFRRIGGTINLTDTQGGEYRTTNSSDHLLVTRHSNQVVLGLYVQPGAANPGTNFTMHLESVAGTATDPGSFVVNLTATSAHSSMINDVGSKGFRKSVLLFINVSFLYQEGLSLANLKVGELKVNDTIVPTRSYVFTDENGTTWLVGQLAHFSGWVPIQD